MFRAFCVAYAMEGSTLKASNISLSKTFSLFFSSFGSLMFESSLPFWLLNFIDK